MWLLFQTAFQFIKRFYGLHKTFNTWFIKKTVQFVRRSFWPSLSLKVNFFEIKYWLEKCSFKIWSSFCPSFTSFLLNVSQTVMNFGIQFSPNNKKNLFSQYLGSNASKDLIFSGVDCYFPATFSTLKSWNQPPMHSLFCK